MTELHEGDCRTVLPTLPAASFDVIVADPPYGIGYRHANGVGASGRSQSVVRWEPIAGDEEVDPAWLAEAYRVLKTGGALYLCTRWDVEPEWRGHLRAAGFLVKQRLTWNKRVHGKGDLRGTYAQTTEDVLFATKGRHLLNGRPSSLLDVGCVPTWEKRHHPHQKPVELPRLLIRASCPPGGRVLDPFCGSGTTLLAADAEGMDATGIEQDAGYCDTIRKRLAEAAKGDGLFAA